MAQAPSKIWFAWLCEEALNISNTFVSSKRSSKRRYQLNRRLKALIFVPFFTLFALSLHPWCHVDTKGPIVEVKLCGESAMYGLHLQMMIYEFGCIGGAISAELELQLWRFN